MSIQQNLLIDPSKSSNDFEFTNSYFSKSGYRKTLKSLPKYIYNGHFFGYIFPPFKWLPEYKWRQDFGFDLMSGFTTGVMLIPQGIAYAFLSGVDPINGLYSSFLSPFFYFLFGLSPHVSRGPSSVLGVMSQISNQAIYAEATGHGISADELTPSNISLTLTFTCGLIQILMGILQFRFLSDYFSDALISGFVCAAGLHTVVSQLNKFVGVKTQTHSSYFGLFLNLYELASKWADYKWQTIILSCCSIAFLLASKSFLAPWIRRKFMFVLPYELLLIVLTTALSYFFNWNSKMSIVGQIPSGFPQPQWPIFELIPYCLPHAIAISCVTTALHFSMTKLFANKFHYSISLSHELYAVGFGSLFSGFFPTYPCSTALARTMVLVESGARTQLASGLSSVLVLIVILFIGPLFKSLPQCVLSAIIVVSLKTIFLNFKSVLNLWRMDKFDCVIWFCAFVGTLFTNVIVGLGIAVLSSLLTPSWSFKHSSDRSLCIFKFNASLLFPNCERFTDAFNKTMDRWQATKLHDSTSLPQTDSTTKLIDNPVFVFDCASINHLDTMGFKTLQQCVKVVEKQEAQVQFSNVNSHVMEALKSVGLESKMVDN